jgi:hypothetical protein
VRKLKTWISGVPLEVVPKKHGVGLDLHFFFWSRVLRVGGVWLDKVGAELQNLGVPNTPIMTRTVNIFFMFYPSQMGKT